uniref:Ovule protein n=1 Tax=Schistosoma mansoni TaxID=6183 RepID=A0A5K4F7W8_SCHMA
MKSLVNLRKIFHMNEIVVKYVMLLVSTMLMIAEQALVNMKHKFSICSNLTIVLMVPIQTLFILTIHLLLINVRNMFQTSRILITFHMLL